MTRALTASGRLLWLGLVVVFALAVVPAAQAQEAEKELIAVLELRPVGATAVEASAVTDRLREELLKTGRFKLVDRSQMEAVLAEQALQQAGCTEQECAVQVGQVLGVRKIVAGKVTKLSNILWQLSALMVDVETAETIRAESIQHRGDFFALLTSQVPALAAKLAQTGRSAPPVAVPTPLPPLQRQAQVKPEPKPKPKPPPEPEAPPHKARWPLWTGVGLLGGSVVFAAAANSAEKQADKDEMDAAQTTNPDDKQALLDSAQTNRDAADADRVLAGVLFLTGVGFTVYYLVSPDPATAALEPRPPPPAYVPTRIAALKGGGELGWTVRF